jgi:hypothetical protein
MPVILALLGFVIVNVGRGQSTERSPADLIKFLTYQSDRQPNPMREFGVFSCGWADVEGHENREAAASLVKLGASAIPSLEGALDSVERQGRQSEFTAGATWLLYAYAKLEGPIAYPRLQRMISSPRLNLLQPGLDNAVALSLGLTSYVSSSRRIPAGEMIYCDGETPRDVLDQLILAWEKNNLPSLEASLGPSAKAALQSLLRGKDWEAIRADLWRGKSGGNVAMGYRFDTAGRLAKPVETLEEEERQVVDLARIPMNFELDTLLKNGSGGDCGKRRIKFFSPKDKETVVVKYLVDNTDLQDLLSSIAACAVGSQ